MKNKLLKFFKDFVIFLMIAGILFSNIPFNALFFLIDSYEKMSGIVDKIWLVQQENNSDVVDKFLTFRDAAEKIKVKEAQAAIIAQYTGGLLVYADTVTVGTPKYQVFDDTTGFGAEQSAQSVGASAINWIRVAASPTNDEWIIVTRDAANVIKAQVCTGIDGGVSCGTPTTITATAGTHGFRNYDVAYEQTSGDALLVYGTATVDALRKIEWTGGAWTLDAAITTTRTAGTVEWVELTSRPASNQIGIAYSDSADDVSAYRWDGTTAANEATVAITTTAPTSDVRKFDVSFEGTSGDMLVVSWVAAAGTAATGQLVGTTWTIGTQAGVDQLSQFVDTQEPNPSDDDIAVSSHGAATATNPSEGWEWDGAAANDGNAGDDVVQNWAANYQLSAVAYLNTTYYAVTVISNGTATDDIDWWTMNNAGSITDQTVNVRTRGASRFIDLFDYPNMDKVLLLSTDANSDLWADTWDGTAPSATVWVDRSATALETSLSIATKDVVDFAFRLAPIPTTTLATGSDPGAGIIIAPGAGAQDVDLFTLQTNSGTETITSVTVNLSTNNGVGTLAITDNANAVLGSIGGGTGSGIVTGSNAISVSGMSAISGSATTFKVRVTPLSHANMLAPDGADYSITAPVTSWAGNYANHAGSDTNPNALTIDNNSPAGTTGAGATSGESTQSTVSWTNPGDTDFQQVYIYCKTSSMISGEAPTEGADPAVDATACDGTARMKYKGTVSGQIITGLTNGTPYYFRIYARDTNGNFTAYSATQEVTATPSAPSATLTISASAGSKVATKNSGDVNQYAHDTACTGAASCAAFTLAASGGAVNVTSIIVTENGTVAADNELSNVNLYYDFDGNWSDAGAETLFGTQAFFFPDQTVNISGTLAISSGQTAYIYVRYDLASGATYPQGGATVNFQIANAADVVSDGTESGSGTLGGTQTVRPNVTSITYPITSPLNGARIGQSITINGYGFGITCDGTNNRVTIGGVGNVVSCTGTTFSDTSISITNFQYSSGDSYGGAATLLVRVGATDDNASQDMYVYPDITSLSVSEAREGDTVTINGNHFGTGAGASGVTIDGVTATGCTWSATALTNCIVPAAINDANNSVTVRAYQGTGGSNSLYDESAGFGILPKIDSISAASFSDGGYQNGTFTLNGSHFGASAGSISVNGQTQDGTPTWGVSTITGVGIPDSGTDSGSITLTRSDTKTSNALPNFYIYPQITSFSAAQGDGDVQTATITITGNHFGTGGTGTNILINGVNPSSVTWTSSSSLTAVDIPNSGTDSGVIVVTNPTTTKQSNNSSAFVIYPQITSIVDDFGGASDTAREYSALDNAADNSTTDLKDGEIQIDGNHFGAAGTVTILGSTATQAVVGTRCSSSSYTATCITVQVPTAIADNLYTGNIVVTRTSDTNANTYAGFRVLPRIISTSHATNPNLKGGRGDTGVSINGDHLCQSGTCPSAFSATNSVNFNGGSVTSGASVWTDTSIPSIVIPGTAIDGNLNITSNTSYTSNNLTFDIKFSPSVSDTGRAPANAANNQSKNLIETGSAFTDGTDGDAQSDSEWQVDEEGTFVTPEWTDSVTSVTSVTVNTTDGAFAGNRAGQTELACGTTYSWRFRYKDNGGVTSQEWSAWSNTWTFTTVPCGPDATSVTYQLNSDGARSGYSAIITGTAFGTATDGNQANCAGGAGTGCVKFTVGGTATVADADVTAWSDTSISFTVNSALASDGGVAALEVTAAGVADTTKLTFYIYPTVSSPGYTATFSDGGYQDGTITITGDHLGSSGATTNISFNGQNPESVGVWTSTSISTVATPNAGADSGTITITRASDSKASNASSNFYIYPQITSFSAAQGDGDVQTATITITGNHFGTGGTGTNILINGVNPSSVTWTSSSSLTAVDIPNAGADSGVIVVTNPTTTKQSNNSSAFVIYPQITSIVDDFGGASDTAREYSALDNAADNSTTDLKDGEIQIDGNHFGAAGTVTILGSTATQAVVGTRCSSSSYTATCITVQVPTAIADNLYTGNIVVTRTSDTNANTYAGFRVLPRVLSLTPDSGEVGTSTVIAGDHFCQTGTCKTAAQYNATADDGDDIKWGTTNATVTGTPSDTSVTANAPNIATGAHSVTVVSNSYISNGKTFTILVATITIGSTAGSKVAVLNSGDTSQYANTTGCTSAADCSAFTLSLSAGTDTVTSIKITQTGTSTATTDMSNLALFYDTDGNYSNGVTGQYGSTVASFISEAATVSGSLGISTGTTYYFYVRSDIKNGANAPKGGQTINFQIVANGDIGTSGSPVKTGAPQSLAGTTTVRPNATSISYAVGGDGGRSGNSATISGYGFGAPTGANMADCITATVDRGCVKFIVGGTTNVASGDITSWTNTSIAFNVVAGLASDGGVSSVEVRAANQADATPLTYYIYPTVSSPGYTATFSDGGYQDGTITITGDHLGSSGATTNISFNGTTPESVGTWTSTSISTVATPNAGADSGTITVTRASDSKASNASSNFYIYPQITSFTNTTDGSLTDGGRQAHVVTITGNHFGTGGTTANISVNGVAPSSIGAWGTGSITTVDIPDAGNDSGVITVTSPGTGKTSNNSTSFYIYPTITSFSAAQGDGDIQTATITITGNHFGTGGTGTNILINGVNPSSVTWTSSSSLTAVDIPNAGTDSGVIVVTNPATTKSSNNSTSFYIYPQITGIIDDFGGASDTAREYSALDNATDNSTTDLKDGEIQIDGNHFGAAGTVTILGSTATQAVVGTRCSSSSYTATCITVQVPTAIADNLYTGNIVVTRTSDTNANTYAGFRVLPRIISTSHATNPNLKGGRGDTGVSINGDHLCQSGTCPSAFSATNKVSFNAGEVTSGASVWTNSSIPSIVIPGTAIDGNLNITSDTSYVSNNLTFDIKFSPTSPTNGDPAGLSDVVLNPILNGSAFTDGTDGDSHTDSDWQIDEEGTFAAPEWSEALSSVNISITVNNTNGSFANNLSGQTALACSTTYSFRARYKDNAGVTSQEWSAWSTTSTFTTALCGPNATSVSDSTEPALTDGGRIGHTIVISGTDFGTVSVGNRAICTGVGNGCVKIGGTGGQMIADVRVTAWANTSITISLSLTDLTTTYGGATTNGLIVYRDGVSDASGLTFYVYPDITSLTAPLGTNDGAREYAATDTDGIITITGNKFGTAPAGGQTVIVGGTVATYVADGTCDAVDGWTETCIKVQVPTTISDSTDSGYAIITQGTGTNSKTSNSTDAQSAINIWPRVTGFTGSQSEGGYQSETFILSGNHFGASAGTILVNGQTQDGTPTWGAASITGIGIPNSGTDSGSITLTKSDTKTSNIFSTFYIYPQITSFTATQGDGDVQTATITITGNHFGTGGTGTNILINGVNPSSVTWTSSSSLTAVDIPNAGTDSGVIVVTNPATTKSSNNSTSFYIYPQITSIVDDFGGASDTAREYSASDNATDNSTTDLKDGEIQIDGNHLGAAGTVTILGSTATQAVVGTRCSSSSYTATCITVQVPTTIADNLYTGNIVVTRTSDTNANTYAGFRVLSRIVSLNPDNGITNDPVIIIGNHFCQTGTCPLAGSRSTASNNVTFFNAVQVTDGNVTAWGHGDSSTSGVNVNVPSSAATGNVVVASDSYTSNGINFTKASSAPADPTNLYQFETNTDLDEPPASYDPLTETNPAGKVAVGGGINQTNAWMRATASAGVNATLCIEVEAKTVATAFDGTGTVLATSAPGCQAFTVGTPVKLFVNVTSGLTDGNNYKWRARIKNNGTSEYGGWVNASVDGQAKSFYIDTSAPSSMSITCPPSAYTASTADLSWSPADNMSSTFTKQAQYDDNSDFSSSICSPDATCGTPTGGLGANAQTTQLTGLAPSTIYYYRSRSKDAAGNEKIEGYGLFGNTTCTFTTSQAQMRTAEYIITGETGAVSAATSRAFQVYITEQGSNIQNAFVEISGIAGTGGGASLTFGMKAVGSADPGYTNYDVAVSNTVATPFTILHKVNPTASGLYIAPTQATNNNLWINPSVGPSVYIASAKIVVTYYYTPQ